MGNALRMQRKFKAALPFMKKARALYQKLDLKGPRAYVLSSLYQTEKALGHVAAAQQSLRTAEHLFKIVDDKRGSSYVRQIRRASRQIP